MKHQILILSIAIAVFSGCKGTQFSTAGSDDVYTRAPAEVRTQVEETYPDNDPASGSEYRDNDTYGTYDGNMDEGYSTYSSRINHFHNAYSPFDYYNPIYSNSFSIGFSWNSYGAYFPMNSFYNPWCSNYGYLDPFYNYSWYNSYLYTCPPPVWNFYNPWGYYPGSFSYNNWGWNPWQYNYPWYYNDPHHNSSPGHNNPQYYGPRKWGGSNTYSPKEWGTGRENLPSTPSVPGENNPFGNTTTPSGIQINKGAKPGVNIKEEQAPVINNNGEQGIPTPKPRQEIKYYAPGNKVINEDYKPIKENEPAKPSNPGIKINKGNKFE